MELTGTQHIGLPREQVWRALNDPEILRQCIPGCDMFEPIGDNEYQIGMTASVGPVKAKFKGKLQLADIAPPLSYALSFEGSGGTAGFGKGNANVQLSDTQGGTELHYSVQAKVGGRLAQIGSRLIDGVAKKMADEFFNRFNEVISSGPGSTDETIGRVEQASLAGAHAAGSNVQARQSFLRSLRWLWVAGACVLAAIVIASIS